MVANADQPDLDDDDVGDGCDPATCGDGQRTGGEVCDDGNRAADDGCSLACTIDPGFTCEGAVPDACSSICSDGVMVGAETCDDGDAVAGDGCDATCRAESTAADAGCCGTGGAGAPAAPLVLGVLAVLVLTRRGPRAGPRPG